MGREIKGSLTSEQKQALETITGAGGIAVLVGRAGTGKGVTIAAAARAWQLEDNEVIGTADRGSDRATTAGRCEARPLLYDRRAAGRSRERTHPACPDSVVVMDEAGMADTERVSRLVKMTAERKSKLVLAGDAAQLLPIGAGGLFKQLQGNVPDSGADRGPPRTPRVGAQGVGADPKRRTTTRALAVQGP